MSISAMSTLAWILGASLLGGVLSVVCAAFLALNVRSTWIPLLISYAIGALLGAAFLEILPHAFEEAGNMKNMAATVLVGILLFSCWKSSYCGGIAMAIIVRRMR